MPTAEKRRRMQELAAERAAAAAQADEVLTPEEEAGLEEGLADLAAGRVTDGPVTDGRVTDGRVTDGTVTDEPQTFTYEQLEAACVRSFIDGMTTSVQNAKVRPGDTVFVRYVDAKVIKNAEAIASAIRNGRDDVTVLFLGEGVSLERYDENDMLRLGWARVGVTRVMTPAMLAS
jgi:predicted transcriptional regulator